MTSRRAPGTSTTRALIVAGAVLVAGLAGCAPTPSSSPPPAPSPRESAPAAWTFSVTNAGADADPSGCSGPTVATIEPDDAQPTTVVVTMIDDATQEQADALNRCLIDHADGGEVTGRAPEK